MSDGVPMLDRRSRGARALLCALALGVPAARAGSSAPACADSADPLASLSDFEYGLNGWDAGNRSQWAWRLGCDGGSPCASAGHGYLLAVGRSAPLLSPPLLGSCASLSYFASAGVQLVVEAVDGEDGARPLATLPPGRGWRASASIALPPQLVRLRISARPAPGASPAWPPAGAAGVDSVLFRLLPRDEAGAAAAATDADAADGADGGDGGEPGAPLGAPAGGWPLAPSASLSPVGVVVSTLFARRKLPLGRVARLLAERGVLRAKVYQYEPQLLDALLRGGVRELTVGIPNLELHNLALSAGYADTLVGRMAAHAHAIAFITVGNEPLASWWGGEFAGQLPGALANVQAALRRRGWQARATVALQGDVLKSTWPPSDAAFDGRQAALISKVLPQLLASGSALMVNLYPYFAWRAAQGQVGLDFCTFGLVAGGEEAGGGAEGGAGCVRAGSECYSNMLDAMIDGVSHALAKLELGGLPFLIGEVGWPTGGREPGADAGAACRFANGLIGHARFGRTPLGSAVPALFVFELLDEEGKSASVSTLGASERHYGLLDEAAAPKYPLLWAPADARSARDAAAACPAAASCSADAECGATAEGEDNACFEQRGGFCVPSANATDAQLEAALSWLCAPARQAAAAEKGRARGKDALGAAEPAGGGLDCAPLNEARSECARAPLRERALWGATQYARLHGARGCGFGGAFGWAASVDPELEGSCPLGVCQASVRAPVPARGGAAGGACLVAADCGASFSPGRSSFVGAVCKRRPFASAASGSCRAVEGADLEQVAKAVDWACSVGGVKCDAVHTLCASAPLHERATWVFSAYASAHGGSGARGGRGGNGSACSFSGIARVSALPLADAAPSCAIGTCHMPSQTLWQAPLFSALLALLGGGYAAMRLRAARQLRGEWAEALRLDGASRAELAADEPADGDGEDGAGGPALAAAGAAPPAPAPGAGNCAVAQML